MQHIDVLHRRIGVTVNESGGCAVCVWSPFANEVALISGGKTIPLRKTTYGYWQGATKELQEGARYKIKIDQKDPLPDPASLSQPDGVHGASEVVNPRKYQWTDNAWTNPSLEDYIIYELHTGTFTDEGTFAAIGEKLDHLVALGVTAVELMPVAQFPGDRNWGYDGAFPFAVQNSYGGAAGLQQLVDACHHKGLAVILDVVYNHLGPEGNYLGEYGPYFTPKYHTPWGRAINFDDAWCDGVRRYVVENALMWLRDFHIDALRLDAVHAIKDLSAVHILKEIRLRVDELMAQTGRKYYLIAELDLNDTRYIDPVEKGGYGMDAQWVDEFHHALRVATGQPQTGYYADFNGLGDLAKSYRDAYVYDGQWSAHRKKFFGTKAEGASASQFVVFSQNHDQVGNRMLGERTGQLVSFERQKIMAASIILSPFLPMLFMGEEWSEPHSFQYFVSHTDPELAEAVRKGRKEEFAAFHAEGEAPDPVAEETFIDSKLQWHLRGQEPHSQMLNFYKKLIALRKGEPALKILDRKAMAVHADPEMETLSLHRWQPGNKIACLLNFSEQPRVMSLGGADKATLLLDSAADEWGGPGEATLTGDTVTLQPQSVVVLRH